MQRRLDRPGLNLSLPQVEITRPEIGIADEVQLYQAEFDAIWELDVGGFYLLKGKPVFTWNLLDLKRDRREGAEALAPGKHTLVFDFKYDGLGFATLVFNNMSGLGRGGAGVLKVDGTAVATQTMERTIPVILQWDETFNIGSDTGTPVDDRDYQNAPEFIGIAQATGAIC